MTTWMQQRECPYCKQMYSIAASIKHLTTRECLAAQRELRRQS